MYLTRQSERNKLVVVVVVIVGKPIRRKRNVSTCMQPRTKSGSGITRNAVFLTQKSLQPQLVFVRKDSSGPSYLAATFLYMDVTSTRSVILLDKPGILGIYFLWRYLNCQSSGDP